MGKAKSLRALSLSDLNAVGDSRPSAHRGTLRRRANSRWFASILLELKATGDKQHAMYATTYTATMRERTGGGWYTS